METIISRFKKVSRAVRLEACVRVLIPSRRKLPLRGLDHRHRSSGRLGEHRGQVVLGVIVVCLRTLGPQPPSSSSLLLCRRGVGLASTRLPSLSSILLLPDRLRLSERGVWSSSHSTSEKVVVNIFNIDRFHPSRAHFSIAVVE